MAGSEAGKAAVDAVLTASRTLVGVATRSLGAVAEETTIAQHRALVVLMSRGPRPRLAFRTALAGHSAASAPARQPVMAGAAKEGRA